MSDMLCQKAMKGKQNNITHYISSFQVTCFIYIYHVCRRYKEMYQYLLYIRYIFSSTLLYLLVHVVPTFIHSCYIHTCCTTSSFCSATPSLLIHRYQTKHPKVPLVYHNYTQNAHGANNERGYHQRVDHDHHAQQWVINRHEIY